MRGIIGKIKGLFPVTLANAVYVDGTSQTLADAMDAGELGNIGKSPIIKDIIHMDYKIVPVNRRGSHDCTVMGSDIVSFDKYDDGGGIYYTDIETMTTSIVRQHNFVESNSAKLEMKSVDYKNGKLLVGNGRSGSTADFGRAYIFYEADSWKDMTDTIDFTNCGEYKEIDLTALGIKTYAFWGDGPNNDMVFVSCNLFNDIYRIQLGRGSQQWDNGTFTENTPTDRFNGSWQIINHWHQDGARGQNAAHGGQFYNGHLYLADNHGRLAWVHKCILRDNGKLELQPIYLDALAIDGTDLYGNLDGLCIHDGTMYVQPLKHHSSVSGNVFLTIKVPV